MIQQECPADPRPKQTRSCDLRVSVHIDFGGKITFWDFFDRDRWDWMCGGQEMDDSLPSGAFKSVCAGSNCSPHLRPFCPPSCFAALGNRANLTSHYINSLRPPPAGRDIHRGPREGGREGELLKACTLIPSEEGSRATVGFVLLMNLQLGALARQLGLAKNVGSEIPLIQLGDLQWKSFSNQA